MSKFFILSGRGMPIFLVDENGDPGAFDTIEEANTCALRSPMSASLGYIIIQMDDDGIIGEVQ